MAKGFDLQADAQIGGGRSIEASFGYTSARFTKNSAGNLAVDGDAISGEAAINYSPGTNPPWTIAIGPQYDFTIKEHDAFVRADWEYSSRNPWLAPVQDPHSAQYTGNTLTQISPTLPATGYLQFRSGLSLGDWQLALFVDNLTNSHTITNYARSFTDSYNPVQFNTPPGAVPLPQYNYYSFRPLTVGITATFRH